MNKIYISGKITGDDYYQDKFSAAERQLHGAGYTPVNPAVLPANLTWEQAMRQALCMMLCSDGVAMLPDWVESKGAHIEAELAEAIGMPVKGIEEWIDGGELSHGETGED